VKDDGDMPPLENPQYELMAQALAKGMTKTRAYREAGFTGDRTAASRLSTRVDIKQRVAELQRRNLTKQDARVTRSIDDYHAELDIAMQTAIRTDDAKAMVLIVQTRAKLDGQWIDQSQSVRITADVTQLRNREIDAEILDRVTRGQITPQDLEQLASRPALLPAPPDSSSKPVN
jgi:hypothetical protein